MTRAVRKTGREYACGSSRGMDSRRSHTRGHSMTSSAALRLSPADTATEAMPDIPDDGLGAGNALLIVLAAMLAQPSSCTSADEKNETGWLVALVCSTLCGAGL